MKLICGYAFFGSSLRKFGAFAMCGETCGWISELWCGGRICIRRWGAFFDVTDESEIKRRRRGRL